MKRGKTRVKAVTAVLALAVLGTVPAAQALQQGKTSGPAGCDNTRPGLSYGPGGTNPHPAGELPCLTYTFPDFGESGIIATPPVTLADGATAPGAVMHGGTYTARALTTFVITPPDAGLGRSVDEGAHWQNVKFPPNAFEPFDYRCESDNGFYRDPNTNRVFFYGDGGCSASGGTLNISYTDDNGETWVDNPGSPLQFFPVSDATVMFSGLPRTSDDATALGKAGYPDVIYLCGGGKCFKSLDGGINFTEIKDSSGTDEAGAAHAMAGGPTGVLYGNPASGKLGISRDDGTTWTQTAGALPSGFTPACMRPSGYGSLSVDSQGNLYLGGMFNNQLAITYSKDGAATWASPIQLQMPGVVGLDSVATGESGLCTFDSDWNRPGRITAAYYGWTNGNAAGPHHGYLTMTDDVFAKTAAFTSVQVDSNKDPLLPNGSPCNFPPLHGPCVPHSTSRLDYISVTFNPADGSPWAVFAKDECGLQYCADKADPSNPQGTLNTARNYAYTNWRGAVGTMASP